MAATEPLISASFVRGEQAEAGSARTSGAVTSCSNHDVAVGPKAALAA